MRARRSVRPVQALAGILLAAALALTGCSGGADSDSGGDSSLAQSGAKEAAPGAAADSGNGASGAKATAPPKLTASHIIRTASLTVQVKDVPKALDAARSTTENAGGYVGDESTTRDEEGRERTRVVLRVPVDEYDEVLTDLQGAGKLLERTAKAQDVTDQVVDVDSRIKSQRASVARVRELMDQATKLSDVVTLEGELSRREADLEALLAQQASLKDRTSLATITLSLSETPVKKAAQEDDDPGFVDAVAGGWDAFVTMLRWIVVVLGAVLPFAAVIALIVLVWLRIVRPRLPRRPAAASAMTALGPLPTARQAPEPTHPREGDEEN
ncbi:DUF4349 domain-containing protein [Streptomyces sp. NL15-2K]|uniref:DUF4349 domain-containing protein n=1 Tax=Streptomyces sp. NL15-2K TaxID=376149 RepID=UPI000F58BC25|nr:MULTISPECIES: DUF4349 domain-containing protein [Actinomycetes]WKX13369.1 DUF4349 domain-containing protein [Kutzneria buriramensis]GCB45260.1 hypothetical protein SNL152K_2550 [Streptomyces sp. NL15-2K]